MFKKTVFPNGLKLITAPVKGTEAITVLVLLPVGSRYEAKKINGASHFIEHLLFKGTEKRPNNLVIAKELDGLGAEYNAFTGKDHTGYWIKVKEDRIEIALDVLADMIFNSIFDPAEVERERGVIVEEIKMYEDNPLFYIEDLFEQTLYGRHPLGWLISGTEEIIKKIKRDEILDFWRQFYQPNKILIVLSGAIKSKQSILKLIQKYFSRSVETKKTRSQFQGYHLRHLPKPLINLLFRETKQVQLALGVPAYSYFHPKIEELTLFALILGGNMSSRLFTEVRVKRGLAYFIKTNLNFYQDAGNFIIQAGLDQGKITEAIKVILDELRRIKNQGVSPEELQRAKDYFEGKLKLALEDSAEVAGWYGKQELLIGKILTPQEKTQKIQQVTRDGIKMVARDILKSGLNLAMIGPFKDRRLLLSILEKRL